jgi:hypothetical protein
MARALTTFERIGQACGLFAGIGALLAAGVHQGLGGPETADVLSAAQGQVSAEILAQTEAVWIAGTISFVLFGLGLIWAAWKRRGWLYSIGGMAAIWFGAVAIAFVVVGPRWGADGLAPQTVLLAILAGLSGAAALSVRPRAGAVVK